MFETLKPAPRPEPPIPPGIVLGRLEGEAIILQIDRRDLDTLLAAAPVGGPPIRLARIMPVRIQSKKSRIHVAAPPAIKILREEILIREGLRTRDEGPGKTDEAA